MTSGHDGMPPQGQDFADFLRRSLHAAADHVEPNAEGLERIRARVRSGPAHASRVALGSASSGFLADAVRRWNAVRGGHGVRAARGGIPPAQGLARGADQARDRARLRRVRRGRGPGFRASAAPGAHSSVSARGRPSAAKHRSSSLGGRRPGPAGGAGSAPASTCTGLSVGNTPASTRALGRELSAASAAPVHPRPRRLVRQCLAVPEQHGHSPAAPSTGSSGAPAPRAPATRRPPAPVPVRALAASASPSTSTERRAPARRRPAAATAPPATHVGRAGAAPRVPDPDTGRREATCARRPRARCRRSHRWFERRIKATATPTASFLRPGPAASSDSKSAPKVTPSSSDSSKGTDADEPARPHQAATSSAPAGPSRTAARRRPPSPPGPLRPPGALWARTQLPAGGAAEQDGGGHRARGRGPSTVGPRRPGGGACGKEGRALLAR